MLDSVLSLKNIKTGGRAACKTLVSAALIVLAVALPQIVHLAAGMSGGIRWLPMYLPVLIGGCLLGVRWGLAVGVLSPLVSFVFTRALSSSVQAISSPMPAAERLPFMIAELAVFAAVSGLFSKKIYERWYLAFAAAIAAEVAGRVVFLGLIALTQSFTVFTAAQVWQQILEGWPGLLVLALLAPAIIIALRAILIREEKKA